MVSFKKPQLYVVPCYYCGGKCDQRCIDAFLTEPGVHTFVSKTGVKVTSELHPNIAPPVPFDEDWLRFGKIGFLVISYRTLWRNVRPRVKAAKAKRKLEEAAGK